MANPIRFFLFPITILHLFNCTDNLFEDKYPYDLSKEEKPWLNDSDNNGVADSLEVYAKDCKGPIRDCLKTAQENKKKEEKRIRDSLELAAVDFSHDEGLFYKAFQVEITNKGDGTIRYDTNGAEPSEKSAAYKGPISITVSTELKARIFSKSGNAGSVKSAKYELKVKKPAAVPEGGAYTDTIKAMLVCETDETAIFYTLDGSLPSVLSKKIEDSLEISSTSTILAQAMRNGWTSSDTLEVSYRINIPGIVVGPVFTPKGGTFTEPQEVGVTSETEGADIRYTLDGKDPDTSSELYSDKISVDKGMTIKAIAMKEGLKSSPVSEAEFTINIPGIAAAPVFTPKGGTYSEPQEVGVTSETGGADIRYTLDGKDPDTSSELYSDKISVDKGMTIKAIAMKDGLKASPVSEAVFTIILDTLGPAVTLINPSRKDTTVTVADFTIEVTAQDFSGVQLVKINGEEASLSAGKYTQTLTLSSGENKIVVMAEDESANQNKSADTLKITYDPPPDAVTLFSPTHITGEGMRITWSENDNSDFQAYKIYYSDSPSVSTSGHLAHVELYRGNTAYSLSGLSWNITYYVKVYVFDNNSSAGSNQISAFMNTAPVFADVPGQTVEENSLLSFTISATDGDGNQLTYSMLDPPVGDGRPAFDPITQTFSWTPTYTDSGKYVAKFEVTDNARIPGQDTLHVNIAVIDVNKDTQIVRKLLDANGLSTLAIDGGICTYINGRISALYLDEKKLTHLPPEIQNLTELRVLSLDKNELTQLPDEIGKLINLTELFIATNQLDSLPSSIGNLTKLKKLWAYNNELTSLPAEIVNLINLTEFSIRGNRIRTLPSGIVNLTKLTELHVGDNNLCDLSETVKTWINTYSGSSYWESTQSCPPPPPQISYFTDTRDNKQYKYVKIGEQNWMAENLAYLPQVDAVSDGSEDDSSGKYYYVYGYTPSGTNEAAEVKNAKADSNFQTYGVLYNWYAAMNGAASSSSSPSGVQGVCPEDWHLPSHEEFITLENAVGTTQSGKKLKSNSWNGTNDFGFAVLPAGHRGSNYSFNDLGSDAYFWTASKYDAQFVWTRLLSTGFNDVDRNHHAKYFGFSVRCLEDQ